MESPRNGINVKSVAPRYSLPLFMVSRNRLKYTKLNELKKYIERNNNIYEKFIDKDFETATLKHLQNVVGHRVGFPTTTSQQTSKVQTKASQKQLEKPWQLAPNRYDTSKIPYEKKMGIGGAHWAKDHTHQSKTRGANFRQIHTTFYNPPKLGEKIFSPCNRTKGIFLSNARDRRATARCMINDVATCYKNPADPGPATYNIPYEKISPSKNVPAPNPHLFHRLSIVPVKRNVVHPPNISFTAAPGRYEIRYPHVCPCSSKLIYQPQIDLLIDKEKRKKFRRLPFEKIKSRRYTAPDWRHVRGRGFRHLFMGAKQTKIKTLSEQEAKRQKTLQLYPDSKYIGMINNPSRAPLSFRTSPALVLLPRIKFNCISKKITRKQLKSNKKIAFNSSQERFKDGYRIPILTQKEQEAIKMTLPLERQFRDRPVMNKRPSEIKNKLDQTPQHMLANYIPKLRKKIFKFLPLPEAKVLVTESDTNVEEVSKEGFYLSVLDPKKFFRDGL